MEKHLMYCFNIVILLKMKPNKKQWEKLHWFFENNSSAIWDGKFGWYSDGSFVCDFYWSFDETKENCKLTINTDGSHY